MLGVELDVGVIVAPGFFEDAEFECGVSIVAVVPFDFGDFDGESAVGRQGLEAVDVDVRFVGVGFVGSALVGDQVALDVGVCDEIGPVHEARIVGVDFVVGVAEVVGPAVVVGFCELESQQMDVVVVGQGDVWGREGALDVLFSVLPAGDPGAGEVCQFDGVCDPVCEDDLGGDDGALVGVELDVEVVPFDQSVDREAFVDLIGVALGGDGEGDLGRLEVEVFRSVGGYQGVVRVGGIHFAGLGGGDVSVEVAGRDSTDGGVREGQIGGDLYDYLAPGQHVGLWEVGNQAKSYLDGACFSDWKFFCLNHGVDSHFPDVAGGLVDAYNL